MQPKNQEIKTGGSSSAWFKSGNFSLNQLNLKNFHSPDQKSFIISRNIIENNAALLTKCKSNQKKWDNSKYNDKNDGMQISNRETQKTKQKSYCIGFSSPTNFDITIKKQNNFRRELSKNNENDKNLQNTFGSRQMRLKIEHCQDINKNEHANSHINNFQLKNNKQRSNNFQMATKYIPITYVQTDNSKQIKKVKSQTNQVVKQQPAVNKKKNKVTYAPELKKLSEKEESDVTQFCNSARDKSKYILEQKNLEITVDNGLRSPSQKFYQSPSSQERNSGQFYLYWKNKANQYQNQLFQLRTFNEKLQKQIENIRKQNNELKNKLENGSANLQMSVKLPGDIANLRTETKNETSNLNTTNMSIKIKPNKRSKNGDYSRQNHYTQNCQYGNQEDPADQQIFQYFLTEPSAVNLLGNQLESQAYLELKNYKFPNNVRSQFSRNSRSPVRGGQTDQNQQKTYINMLKQETQPSQIGTSISSPRLQQVVPKAVEAYLQTVHNKYTNLSNLLKNKNEIIEKQIEKINELERQLEQMDKLKSIIGAIENSIQGNRLNGNGTKDNYEINFNIDERHTKNKQKAIQSKSKSKSKVVYPPPNNNSKCGVKKSNTNSFENKNQNGAQKFNKIRKYTECDNLQKYKQIGKYQQQQQQQQQQQEQQYYLQMIHR